MRPNGKLMPMDEREIKGDIFYLSFRTSLIAAINLDLHRGKRFATNGTTKCNSKKKAKAFYRRYRARSWTTSPALAI